MPRDWQAWHVICILLGMRPGHQKSGLLHDGAGKHTLGIWVIGLVTAVLCPSLMASALTVVARGLHLSGMRGLGNSHQSGKPPRPAEVLSQGEGILECALEEGHESHL